MSTLNKLLGPALSYLDSILPKRGRIDYGAGLQVQDGGAQDDVVRISSTGTVLVGSPVATNPSALGGWILAYSSALSAWVPVCGLVVVSSGHVQVSGATPVVVYCAGILPTDTFSWSMNTPGGSPQAAPRHMSTDVPGNSFTVSSTATDSSIYNYIVLRAGDIPPA
jgi:hypothetical protein